jgi:hypothetical protein
MPQKQEHAGGEIINDKIIRRIAESLKDIKFGHVFPSIKIGV